MDKTETQGLKRRTLEQTVRVWEWLNKELDIDEITEMEERVKMAKAFLALAEEELEARHQDFMISQQTEAHNEQKT